MSDNHRFEVKISNYNKKLKKSCLYKWKNSLICEAYFSEQNSCLVVSDVFAVLSIDCS